MREILFRGQIFGSREWVYGHYRVGRKLHIIYNDENSDHCYAVRPESVGQFTGLTDKNGKKIFEGDLLNGFEYPFYRSESNEHNYFAEVVWFDENCAFGLVTHKHLTSKVRGISAGNADYIEDFNSEEWEVIGNIHDNPELLKEVDK